MIERDTKQREISAVDLEPARRMSLAQNVLNQLMRQIQSGALRPGDKLSSEAELMRMMQVGRSSLREAMRALATIGWIQTSPGKPAVVTSFPSPFRGIERDIGLLNKLALMNLLEVREAIEGQAARLAAQRATPEEQRNIRAKAEVVRYEIERGLTYVSSNNDFHLAIARAAHNSTLVESVELLIRQMRGYRKLVMHWVGEMPNQDVAEHDAIARAIEEQDQKAAYLAMIEHIRNSAKILDAMPVGLDLINEGRKGSGAAAISPCGDCDDASIREF